MNAKERMLAALSLKKPDRLPATIHQWQPYHLKTYMNGMDDIEAFCSVGLDAAITFVPFVERESADWKITREQQKGDGYEILVETFHTPKGDLVQKKGINQFTTWVLEPMIKKDEDIYLYRDYAPVPGLDLAAIEQKYDALGDGGILRCFVNGHQGGCWQDACELYGTENMIYAAIDKPDWVHEFLQILADKKLWFIYHSLKGAKVDLIETGGGASSNTVISPAYHEEFCLPYDRRLHDAIHDIGLPVVYHTCGGMLKILDLILQNGCDASETLSPVGVGGDIRVGDEQQIVSAYRGKLAMIGGLDQFNILSEGTPEQVYQEVKRLFDAFGKDGGYILSASDHFFEAPVDNLKAMARAAQECVY